MANTQKAKGNIYNLAKLAKKRLKQNNYTKVKGNILNNANIFESYINRQKELKKKDNKTTNLNFDDELYKKVCLIIESNNVSNPISMLIDRDFFNTLNAEAKQFYIHTLTEKYKFMRSRYFREHPISLYV